MTIEAVFDGGVFRPINPVALPDKSWVQLQIIDEVSEQNDENLDEIYDILDRRYDTGIADLAARHDEHQP